MTILLETHHYEQRLVVVDGDGDRQKQGEKLRRRAAPLVKKSMLNCTIDNDCVVDSKQKKEQLEGHDELRNGFLKMWDGKVG